MLLLKVKDLNVAYGAVRIVWDASLEIAEGEKVALIGPNGAGKTTLLKAIVGLLRPISGEVEFANKRIDKLPAHIVAKEGISLIPEGGRVFPRMDVLENLKLGAFTPEAKAKEKDTLKQVFRLFPVLEERKNQIAGTLSGGEQRMLSIARGLMSLPSLMMLDELSLGLMPTLVTSLFDVLEELHDRGITILLVEQYVKRALEFADRGYLLEQGRVVLEGKGRELLKSEHVREAYL
ncbi:MAG: ABC transporter ATP-binding protein [Candidatus Bathyarchaeia archaeon]